MQASIEQTPASEDFFALADVSVQRAPLSEQIAARLISLIGHDGLRAGDELPSEAKLAAAFDVSRPVIREALRQLQALRMVRLANGKPPEVLPVTSDLLGVYFEWAIRQDAHSRLELQELRVAIEATCAGMAAGRAGSSRVADLRGIVAQMRASLNDMEAYVELDTRLHLSIVSAAGNSLLQHLAESIRQPLRAVIEAGLRPIMANPTRLERMQHDHELIVEAIAARDAVTARAAMEAHLSAAMERLAASEVEGSSAGGGS